MLEADLRAAILRDPDDDAPRRVLADLLLARDDPRGELIAAQCELAGLDDVDPRWVALRRREIELLAAHRSAWMAPWRKARLRRGFVETVEDNPGWIRDHADALGRDPVATLRLTAAFQLAPLLADERLAGIRRLELPVASPPAVQLLLGSPVAARLVSLDLSGSRVGRPAVDAILRGGLPALAHLDLGSTMDRSFMTMHPSLPAPQLPALTDLDLSDNRQHDDALVGLLAELGGLRTLRLTGNVLGPGCRALLAAPPLQAVRRLGISCAARPTAALLAGGFPALEELTLGVEREIRPDLAAAAWPRLRALALRDGGADVTLLQTVAARPWPLRRLSLVSATRLFGGVLRDGPAFRGLTELRWTSPELIDDTVEEVVRGSWPQLHTLRLRAKRLTDRAARAIAGADLPRLTVVDLRKTAVGEAGLEALRARFGAGVGWED